MEQKWVNELNTLLKGEHMAIDAYERYIQDTEDERIKNQLQKIQKDHKMHATNLSGRIQTLGGQPEYSTGFTGFMASAKAAMENVGSKDDVDILKNAYDGEDKGIAMAEEIVKGDLDEESAKVVNGILSEDHDHLKSMIHLIAGFEVKY